jgi:thiol:disulfide interchange protein
MKRLLLFVFCCASYLPVTYAQSVLKWTVKAQKIDGKRYRLIVDGTIRNGWYTYAKADTANGITGLQLKSDNIRLSGSQVTGPVQKISDVLFNHNTEAVYIGQFGFEQDLEGAGHVLKVTLSGFAANGKEFQPINESRELQLESGTAAHFELKLNSIDLNQPVNSCGEHKPADHGLLSLFLLGFLGGLLALLTPCVFPMIPLTVSWFTSQSGNKKIAVRNGSLYGAFIVLIYVAGSIPFHLIGSINPEIFNTIATNIWVNLLFFVLFVFFALSFFGLFEITFSGKLTNKVDDKSNLASLGGIFFMALTLALVSFSCTGPILGTLLVGSLSSNGGAWQLTVGMAGFGIALALPFSLFAMFPNWLQRLPKSGGWLGTVKKVLAFLELAFAFKFLSNADLVGHWGILKREIFIGIWLLISVALALYLITSKKASNGRIVFGITIMAFALYLIPGLTNTKYARLNLLSGFPPPLSYSIYHKPAENHLINDYETALRLSKAEHKPILIDFTGWACVNCRKMEENVWTKPEVSTYMKDHFILVSLYVDDRKALMEPYRFGTKEINTDGDQWATFESVNFHQVTQPLYAIVSPDQKLMNTPVGYTPDAKVYLQWLKCGDSL